MSTLKKINNSSSTRLFVALLVGIAAAIIGLLNHIGSISLLIGWEVAVLTLIIWVWAITWPMDHKRTAEFARREDPGRVGVDILLILASVASLGAVGYALFQANSTADNTRQLLLTCISLFSVVVSWALIHTIYTLRYARLYFSDDAETSVDFNNEQHVAYSDFYYVALTVGMTFQVADTNIKGSYFRKTILRHSLLSYAFGTVIIATTISLISGLGK